MFANRRKSERRACRSLAKIQMGGGGLPRDCTIVDISDSGIRVVAEYQEIPSEFVIAIADQRPRRCRLAWRIGFEFGAEFLE